MILLLFGMIVLFDLLLGEPQTPYFYDLRIWGRVPGSQNQIFLSLETPEYQLKHQEKQEIDVR